MSAFEIARLTTFVIAIASFSTWLGFNYAHTRRLRAECRRDGHLWNGIGTGLECERCGLFHRY